MRNRRWAFWVAGVVGLSLAVSAAGNRRAAAAEITLLSENFSGFTAGAPSSGTVDGWTIHPGSASTVNIINTADTNDSNALAFTQPDNTGVAYIQKSFTPATNDNFQLSFDLSQLVDTITGNQMFIEVMDDNSNFFSIRFTTSGRAYLTWVPATVGGINNSGNIVVFDETQGTLNHFTLTYDGAAGTFVLDTGAPENAHKVFDNITHHFKASSVHITSESTYRVSYSVPQIMVDNLKLTTVPEPASLGLLSI
jgi:hypothetical protein